MNVVQALGKRPSGTLDHMRDEGPAVVTDGLAKWFGSVSAVIDVSLDVASGEILALLGPSGCGKTTLLRLIAGFERPDEGTIELGGRFVAGRGSFVQPERRHAAFVFQDYALFPHMTVEDNVCFGVPRSERADRLAPILDLVGLAGFGSRYPHELSGGQQQRVALARALAPEPEIVLLDEPFSNLDADLRARVRLEVREIIRTAGATAIFVTHDQQEAFEIADRVAVMREGRIEQVGRPEEIYHTPVTRFVADFVGQAAFLEATWDGDRLMTELGVLVTTPGIPAGAGEIMVRPEDVQLSSDGTQGSEVVERRFQGPVSLTTVRLPSGRTIASAHSSQLVFRVGDRVGIRFLPDHLVLFRGDDRVAWIPTSERTGTDQP